MPEHVDELITVAKETINRVVDDVRFTSTVGSAALTKSGKIFSAVNLYHFTGGPCAEVSLLARLATEDEVPELIVAVGAQDRPVLEPCGKCRQIIFDIYPDTNVIIEDANEFKIIPIKDLLPHTYEWNSH